jgi:hypothetical protein
MNPAALLRAAVIFALVSSASPARPEQPQFQVEIQDNQNTHTYTVTNQAATPVSAFVVRYSFASQVQGTEQWDSVLLEQSPLSSGAHISRPLPHPAGGPFPDHMEIVGGIWANGDAFGQAGSVQLILADRKSGAALFDNAASFLQHGLDENWTYAQFVQAVQTMPDSPAVLAMRSTLSPINQRNAEYPEYLRNLINYMIDRFTGQSIRIRRAKPSLDTSVGGA